VDNRGGSPCLRGLRRIVVTRSAHRSKADCRLAFQCVLNTVSWEKCASLRAPDLDCEAPKVSKAANQQNSRISSKDFKGRNTIGNVGVRSLPRQPRIPAFCQASQETADWAGNPGFSRIRFGLQTPALANLRGKSPKVSGRFRKYSRFGETIGGDGFDQDCRPTLALNAGPTSGSHRHRLGILGLPHGRNAFCGSLEKNCRSPTLMVRGSPLSCG
jgi:hypothetical protein